jgi:xylose isomerase
VSGRRYGVGVWAFGNLGDRFLLDGYRPDAPADLETTVRSAAEIPHLHGLEVNVPIHTREVGVDRLGRLLSDAGLACLALGVEVTADARWRWGSLTSADADVRADAIAVHKEAMDAAAELGAGMVNSWLGQDGHDLAFQQEYRASWDRLVEGYREVARHRPDVRLALEFKPREPRVRSMVPTTGMALLAAQETREPNVGVTIDVGHALHAGESMAQSAVLAARYGRLFHLHFNDNGRGWDDDLPVGTVHTVEMLELLAWLRELGYEGAYSLDLFPFREDPAAAIGHSIEVLRGLERLLDRLGGAALVRDLRQEDALKLHRRIAAAMLPSD